MKILLLGDGHTYGYGLPARQLSYIGHFARQLSRTGRTVTVEAYAHLTLPETTALLNRLPLGQYDLVVLQFGPDLIRRSASDSRAVSLVAGSGWSALIPPARAGRPELLKRVRAAGKTLVDLTASVVPAVGERGWLAQLLTLLRPYRHTVVLMTPFPCRALPGRWLSQRSRAILLATGTCQAFSVFDTHAVVQSHSEYFLTDDGEHLNAVSHELIGRALLDFYQSAPTIITVPSTNRN